MKRIWWIAAGLAILVLQTGCNPTEKAKTYNVRVLNAVVDAEALDVLVDDTAKASAVAVGSTAPTFDVSAATHDIKIRSATTGAQLLDKSVSIGSSTQTLVLYGHRSAPGLLLLNDDTTSAASGKLKVRTVNLSPEAALVDTYVTAAADISAAAASILSVASGSASDYVEIASGSARITFTASGTQDILFQSPARDFAADSKVTLVVFPSSGGKLVNAVLLTPGADATFIANPSARVKAVNAIAGTTLLNFKADGTTLLSNVPFAASSSYVTTSAGTRSLQIEAANVPGTAIAQVSQAVVGARDYSMVAVGSANAPAVFVLGDENYVPASGSARIRFANALDGAASVDVLVNFASLAAGIAPRAASAYYSLGPSDSYNITFATAGGVTVLASLTPVTLESGGVYTAYLLGSAAAPQARLVRDR
jgi:hypothetical protein